MGQDIWLMGNFILAWNIQKWPLQTQSALLFPELPVYFLEFPFVSSNCPLVSQKCLFKKMVSFPEFKCKNKVPLNWKYSALFNVSDPALFL